MITEEIFILITGIFVILSEIASIIVIKNNEEYFESKYEELRIWYFNEVEKIRNMYNVANVVKDDVKQSKTTKKINSSK